MGQGNIIKLIRIKVWSRRLRIVDGCIHPLNVVGRLPSRHRLECYRVFFGCKSDTFRSRLFTVVLFVQWTLVQVPHVSIEFPTPRQDNLWRRWWHLETTMCQIQLFDLLRSSMEERVLYLRLEKGRAVTRRLASRLCHSLEGERLYFPWHKTRIGVRSTRKSRSIDRCLKARLIGLPRSSGGEGNSSLLCNSRGRCVRDDRRCG